MSIKSIYEEIKPTNPLDRIKSITSKISSSSKGVVKNVSPAIIALAIITGSLTNASANSNNNGYDSTNMTQYEQQVKQAKLMSDDSHAMGAILQLGFIEVPEGESEVLTLNDLRNGNKEKVMKKYNMQPSDIEDVRWAFEKHGNTFDILMSKLNNKTAGKITMEKISDIMNAAISLDNKFAKAGDGELDKDKFIQQNIHDFVDDFNGTSKSVKKSTSNTIQ